MTKAVRAPSVHRDAMGLALILAPLLLALIWRVGELALPPHAEHAWRDADGLGVARCLLREGFNVLEPRVMQRGAMVGVVGMEFPLVNAAGAALMKIGGVHDWLARLPCWLALVPLMAGVWALGRRVLANASASAVAAGCLVLQPLVMIYARKCMPEVPMLAALVWGTALAYDAFFLPSLIRGLAAGALLATAALLKPTGFAVAVPVAIWLYRALRATSDRRRVLGSAFLCAAIPVVAVLLWYGHARALETRYGLPLFKLHHDWMEGFALLARGEAYGVFFGRVFHLYLLWPTVIWMVIRWRDLLATARDHGDVVAWAGAGLVGVVLFGSHLLAHPYYALPLLVPLALLIGAFAARASEAFRRPDLAVLAFMAVFAVTAVVRVEQRASTPATDRHRRFDPARLAAAMAHVPVDGLTIATDDAVDVPMSLVIIDRIGWTKTPSELTPEAIGRLWSQGARTLVETSFGGWLAPETRAALPTPVWADGQLRAYRLTTPPIALGSSESIIKSAGSPAR